MRYRKTFFALVFTSAFILAFASCVSNFGGVTGTAVKPAVDYRQLAVQLRDNLYGNNSRQAKTQNGQLPDIDTADWMLKLVNVENPLEADFEPPLAENADMYLFDSRAVSTLDAFLNAGREAGYPFVLTSAYRSHSYQRMLFEEKADEYVISGYGREEAEREAASIVARPGTSEHQLGLAADIVSENYPYLEEGFGNSDEAKWLRENCAEYGFILRYAYDKTDITGIIHEPWHFRYVGTQVARFIMENDLCLEEFLELYD